MEKRRQQLLHAGQKPGPAWKQGSRGDDLAVTPFAPPPKPRKPTAGPANARRVVSTPDAKHFGRKTGSSPSKSDASGSPDSLGGWDSSEMNVMVVPSQSRKSSSKHLYPPSSPALKTPPRGDHLVIVIDDSEQGSPVKPVKPRPKARPQVNVVDPHPRSVSFPLPASPDAPRRRNDGVKIKKGKAIIPAPFPLALTGPGAAAEAERPPASPIDISDDDEEQINRMGGFPMQLTPSKPPKFAVPSRGLDSGADDNGGATRPQPEPFPMSATQLRSYPPLGNGNPSESPYSGFRAPLSEASSDDDQPLSVPSSSSSKRVTKSDDEGYPAKRRKRDPDVDRLSVSLERQSHGSPPRPTPSPSPPPTPSKLCPFCDEPFPRKPSRYLKGVLQSLLSKSWPAPRPSNPRGRDAPLAVSINLCTTHRAESATIPAGLDQGWPLRIDFADVKRRVESERIRKRLKAILADEVRSAHGGERGVFWDMAKKDLEVRGARVANSVQGQMGTFEMTQPGYYGERGFLVISCTLQEMFPSDTIDPGVTYPLEPADFLRRVLLPETAILLIQEDQDFDREEALVVLRKSRAFGLAAFPVRDGDDTGNASFDAAPSPMIAKEMPKGKGKQRAHGDEEATSRAVSPTLGKGKGKPPSKSNGQLPPQPPASNHWLLDVDDAQEQSMDEGSVRTAKAKPHPPTTKTAELKAVELTEKPKTKPKKGVAGTKAKTNLFDESSDESDAPARKAKKTPKEQPAVKQVPSSSKPRTDLNSKVFGNPKPSVQKSTMKKAKAVPPRTGTDDEEDYLQPVVIPIHKAKKMGVTSVASTSKTEVSRHPISTSRRDSDSDERSSSPGAPFPSFTTRSKEGDVEEIDEETVSSSSTQRVRQKDGRVRKGADDDENLEELQELATQWSREPVTGSKMQKRVDFLTNLRDKREAKHAQAKKAHHPGR